MRIAQVSPLYESVPPCGYGGTERIVSYLTEELVKRGHDVTLFASGDSKTSANLISPCPRSLRSDKSCQDPLAQHFVLLESVFRESPPFDLIHFHTDYLHFPWSRREKVATVTTLHGRLDIADLIPLYHEYGEMPLISISEAQRKPLIWAKWCGNVYHGIPKNLYSLKDSAGKYLAFLGRISPEKGIVQAIEIAEHAGMKLKIAAKIDNKDRDYFEANVRPLLKKPFVEFTGEIDDQAKEEFLQNAYALLFPIDWPEPFGIVMIEAMACGTPVIALRRGSVPEVITNGVNGFIVDTVDQAVAAVEKIPTLKRSDCRRIFEERFTETRMAADYVKIYERIVEQYSQAA